MSGDDPRTMTCPSNDVWDRLAAGVTRGHEAELLVEHASWCRSCAALLHSSVMVFGPKNEQRVVPIVARTGLRYALVAACVLIAFAGAWWWRRTQSPESMLAQLAEPQLARRTFAMRIPGAQHRPFDPARSTAPLAPPAELLEARARIQRRLEAQGDSPGWHAASGRLCIIELDASCAVSELKLATELASAASADWRVDLASAYYLRGRRNNNPADLTLAIELLSQVLAADRAHLAARFNRAIAEEEIGLLGPAIEDYEFVAQSEKDSGWKREAEERAARLRAQQNAIFESPLQGAEELLEVALRQGLQGPTLAGLAARLEHEHRDPWLRQTLSLVGSKRAVDVLSRMAAIRESLVVGAYADVAAGFDSLRGLPNRLNEWWEYERIFRATHDFRYACPDREPTVSAPWLATQIERELALCALRAKDMKRAQVLIRRSEERAARHGFKTSRVRALGIRNGLEIRRGRYREALRLAQAGMSAVAAERLPPVRLQQFISGTVISASSLGRWHAARLAARYSAYVAQSQGLGSPAFNTLTYWGLLARRTGEPEEARRAYHAALALWDRSRGQAVPPEWKLWADAQLAAMSGDAAAVAQLEPVIASSKDDRVRAEYQQLRAALEMERGEWTIAASRLDRLLARELASVATDPVWSYQSRLASRRRAECLIAMNRPGEALQCIRRGPAPTENRVALTVADLGGRVGVWKSADGRVEFRWSSIDASRVKQSARRLMTLCSRPTFPKQAIEREAERLAAALFGNWLRQLPPNSSLYFAVDLELGQFPIGVLPGRHGAIGLEHVVAIGPPTEPRLRLEPALGVDATQAALPAGAALAPLEPARQELRAISAASPRPTLLEGSQATVGEVVKRMRGVRVFHYSGHTMPSSDGAALVLTPDALSETGVLGVADLPPTMLDLAVLSACSTGRAVQEESDTELPLALTDAFVLQGAGQVIASYWDVESEASSSFISCFYRALRNRQDAGVALRQAAMGMRDNPRFHHPHYWAMYNRWVTEQQETKKK